MLMVSTTNTITNITNHQILTIKKMVFCSVFWDIFPIFNKPPIEGNQLPVETNRVHYSFVMCLLLISAGVLFFYFLFYLIYP